MKNKTSIVWKFFIEIKAEKAKCKICHKTYSKKGRTTSSLMLHLKTKHKEEFVKSQSEETAQRKAKRTTSSVSTNRKDQLTLQETIDKTQKWPATHQKTMEVDKLIAEMIALHDLPFNFVNAIGFKRLINAAWPSYQMRSREHFTELFCENLYPKMAKKVESLLQNFKKLSFTTDIWSDPSAGVSLLSLTVHGISNDMGYVNIVLKCETVEGSHTGDLIFEKINSILEEWNIKEKVHCIVHDKGSNIVRAMGLSSFGHANCAVHQLQLCIKAAIINNNDINCIIVKVKRIVGYFNHSVLAQDRLKEIQSKILGKSNLGVVQDCSTRWNSTFYMLERILEIRESIILYASKYNKLDINHEDWTIMEQCVAILKPFEEITRQLSYKSTFISSVIPYIYALKKSLCDQQENLPVGSIFFSIIDDLLSQMENQFSTIRKNKLYTIATYLDPRYKTKFFDKKEIQVLQSEIKSILEIEDSLVTSVSEVSIETRESENEISIVSPNVPSLLTKILDDDDEDDLNYIPSSSTINTLLSDYENEKRLISSEDPLTWWRQNKCKFEKLLPIVRIYLSTPAGSVASEQLFSGAGMIYDPLRSQLKPDKAAKLLFIKKNMALFNFEY